MHFSRQQFQLMLLTQWNPYVQFTAMYPKIRWTSTPCPNPVLLEIQTPLTESFEVLHRKSHCGFLGQRNFASMWYFECKTSTSASASKYLSWTFSTFYLQMVKTSRFKRINMKSMEWWIFLKWEGSSNVLKKKKALSNLSCNMFSCKSWSWCFWMSWDVMGYKSTQPLGHWPPSLSCQSPWDANGQDVLFFNVTSRFNVVSLDDWKVVQANLAIRWYKWACGMRV